MTWIKTIPLREGGEALREATRFYKLLPPEYGKVDVPALRELGGPANGGGIAQSHSLIPDALYHAFSTHARLMQPDLPLSRRQHEMIATVVSVINHCFY